MHAPEKTPNPSSAAPVDHWANRLPWWPYAVTTLLLTMIIASAISRDPDERLLPPRVTLPVRSLSAGEFQPAAPLTLRGPALPSANVPERTAAPAIANSREFTPESRQVKQYDAVRSRRVPVPATTPEDLDCRQAGAQPRQAGLAGDRAAQGKDCPS